MSFDDIFRKTSEIGQPVKETEGKAGEFKHAIPVSIYMDGLEEGQETIIDSGEQVQLSYELEMDYRSWGIKDINVSGVRLDQDVLTVGIFDAEDNQVDEVEVRIDASQPTILWEPGSGYAPVMLIVRCDRKGNVSEVELHFFYYKP